MSSNPQRADMKKRSVISNQASRRYATLQQNKMKYLDALRTIPVALVLTLSTLAAFGQQPQPPKNSAENLPQSDTAVSEGSKPKNETLLSACNAAVDELKGSRVLIEALEAENAALRVRLETEKRTTALLTELNDSRRAESEALKVAVAAKNEAITAKDAAIAAQDRLIEQLKTKKRSPWGRVADILLGAGLRSLIK